MSMSITLNKYILYNFTQLSNDFTSTNLYLPKFTISSIEPGVSEKIIN